MKILLIILGLTSLNLHAAETRAYSKINSSSAKVKIVTAERESIQAAIYVDAKENERFIQELMKDKDSRLYKLKLAIEKENCNQFSTPEKSWIEGCGEVTLTKEVRTSFGRGGWASAGAGYTFFVGFTNAGTGRFFDVSHMVTIGESVEAQTTSKGEYAGTILKSLNFGSIVRIDENSPIVE